MMKRGHEGLFFFAARLNGNISVTVLYPFINQFFIIL